jgi:hypothetical protein
MRHPGDSAAKVSWLGCLAGPTLDRCEFCSGVLDKETSLLQFDGKHLCHGPSTGGKVTPAAEFNVGFGARQLVNCFAYLGRVRSIPCTRIKLRLYS